MVMRTSDDVPIKGRGGPGRGQGRRLSRKGAERLALRAGDEALKARPRMVARAKELIETAQGRTFIALSEFLNSAAADARRIRDDRERRAKDRKIDERDAEWHRVVQAAYAEENRKEQEARAATKPPVATVAPATTPATIE